MSGRDQGCFEKEFLGDGLKRAPRHLQRSTFRVAAHRAAPAAADSGVKPFFQRFACDPNAIGLRGVGLELSLVDRSGLEDRLDI
jgi:hypothetical protein